MWRALSCLTLLCLAALASCDGVRADEGRDAILGVRNISEGGPAAQFVRGDWPVETNGPAVKNITLNPVMAAGVLNRNLTGDLDRPASAIALALAGDVGYWIVPAAPPTTIDQGAPSYTVELGIAASTAPGPRDLVLRAVDRENRFGPPQVRTLKITEPKVPEGELVISLSWNNGADLDLHVVDPTGVEVFSRNVNSFQVTPGKNLPGTTYDGGILDIDSNPGCTQDSRRAENVIWKESAPKGRYIVRVDTFALCGEPITTWRATAWHNGDRIGAATGVSTENDLRFEHDRGAGVLAIEVDVR